MNKKTYILKDIKPWNFGGTMIYPGAEISLTDEEYKLYSKKIRLVLKNDNEKIIKKEGN